MRDEIGPVRPLFKIEEEPPKNKRVERLIAGGPSSGMLIDVTKKGVEINGYYTGFSGSDTKYAVLRGPVFISWEDIEKTRAKLSKPKKKGAGELDRIETELDQEYLDTLPKVTINGRRYYIDADRKERRSVDNPKEVWRYS